MYTRCTACHTVHPLNAALLAQGEGKYRCGKCNKLNNALDSLFDEWPAAGTRPHSRGTVPELGLKIDLEAAKRAAEFAEESDGESAEDTSRTSRSSLGWGLAAAALIAATVINAMHFVQNTPVDLLQNPIAADGPAQPDAGADPIQLVSSEMRSHPDMTGALRLSATLQNHTAAAQPYPRLGVTLLDSLGQPLAHSVFGPEEYLAVDADRESGMAAEAYLPLVLNLADPGRQAVGFELEIL